MWSQNFREQASLALFCCRLVLSILRQRPYTSVERYLFESTLIGLITCRKELTISAVNRLSSSLAAFSGKAFGYSINLTQKRGTRPARSFSVTLLQLRRLSALLRSLSGAFYRCPERSRETQLAREIDLSNVLMTLHGLVLSSVRHAWHFQDQEHWLRDGKRKGG